MCGAYDVSLDQLYVLPYVPARIACRMPKNVLRPYAEIQPFFNSPESLALLCAPFPVSCCHVTFFPERYLQIARKHCPRFARALWLGNEIIAELIVQQLGQ